MIFLFFFVFPTSVALFFSPHNLSFFFFPFRVAVELVFDDSHASIFMDRQQQQTFREALRLDLAFAIEGMRP